VDLENTCTRKVTPGLLPPPRAPSLALLPGYVVGVGLGRLGPASCHTHLPSSPSPAPLGKARLDPSEKPRAFWVWAPYFFSFFAPKVPAAVLAVVRHTVRRVENGEPAPRNRRSDLVHLRAHHSTQSELFPAINPKSLFFFSSSSRFSIGDENRGRHGESDVTLVKQVRVSAIYLGSIENHEH
jgi:hypothetical protein